MNDDGHGRRVFDGVLTHVAGAGKVFANQEQKSRDLPDANAAMAVKDQL